MKREKHPLKLILYAFLFFVIIPFFLWFWAKLTESLVRFPAVESELIGWFFFISGSIFLVWGMFALMKYGNGLPMNLQPPLKFVKNGPYKIVKNPIYWGFGILMIGVFILAKSASGLWLVSPITILAMVALVMGYENFDLYQRFPNKRLRTIFDSPENNNGMPSFTSRLTTLFRLFGILIIGNSITLFLAGNASPLISEQISFTKLWGNSYLPICSIVFILTIPFLLKRNDVLREWLFMGFLSIFISLFISLLYPFVGAQYLPNENLYQDSGLSNLLSLATVPVFLLLCSLKSIWRQSRKLFIVFSIIVLLLVFIQIGISRSGILSLATSILIYLIASNYFGIWVLLRNLSERIANSWQEWVFGKIRVINHGFYVGFATFVGLLFGGYLAGTDFIWGILVFVIVVILIAALWAQIIEGSEKLKRPFGFYGGLVGMIFSSLTVWLMGFDIWVIIGVITIFLPWVQAVGRLRCLINGCCHGSPVDNPLIGIRYFHYRSRVCGISGLKGESLHPTQLYSILWLFLIGFIFVALWNNKFPPSFIFGLYLILNGIGRFVEEAFRGEVQTKILEGLRLYQWTAILSVIIGIGFTILPTEPVLVSSGFGWEIVAAAFIGCFCTFFAMGVDFPNSNARFSRLV